MTLDPLALATALALGFLAGLAYLGLLWASLRGLARSARPWLRLGGGAALRLGLLLGALYLIADGQPERLLAALLGVLTARLLATRLMAPPRAAAGPGGA